MKNWKKYAFASASVVALAAGLAACGNLTGNNKKLQILPQVKTCNQNVPNR